MEGEVLVLVCRGEVGGCFAFVVMERGRLERYWALIADLRENGIRSRKEDNNAGTCSADRIGRTRTLDCNNCC